MSFVEPRAIAAAFAAEGYCFPIDIMSPREAAAYRAQLQAAQPRLEGLKLGNKGQLNFAHVILRFAYEMVSRPAILDAVETVIGPDILLWGSTFFTKPPRSESYVSWHQDLRYWGLADDEAQVSAWLALTPASPANGCMRFLPGSHRNPILEHHDGFGRDNFLTRGQEAVIDIDEAAARPVELAPGQLSLHHGRLLHASAPNPSADWRIGYVMNFVAPHNRQVVAPRDYAMLLRGEDRHGHFGLVPPPEADLSEAALAWHARILAAQNESLYDGATQGPD